MILFIPPYALIRFPPYQYYLSANRVVKKGSIETVALMINLYCYVYYLGILRLLF
jgi:hypothetical protein